MEDSKPSIALRWCNALSDDEKKEYCPSWKPGAFITGRMVEQIYLEKR